MPNNDARSLPGAAQAALRNRAVQAVLDGMPQAEAARVFGVHPNAVNRWVKRYREGGWAGLAERRRGRRAGEQAALSAGQQREVIALVRDSTPDQLGLPGFLWTRGAVVGTGGPDPGDQADRQAVWGEPDQRDLQPGAAAVPAVRGVVCRPGVHRLPAAAAAGSGRAEGAPDC